MQHALRGHPALVTYKLGLIEALLKDTLRRVDDADETDDVVRANLRTALDVARWDPPSSPARLTPNQ